MNPGTFEGATYSDERYSPMTLNKSMNEFIKTLGCHIPSQPVTAQLAVVRARETNSFYDMISTPDPEEDPYIV